MNAHEYIVEHKTEMWRLAKHAGPYICAFWAVIAWFVAVGWLDTPAKSQEIKDVNTKLDAQSDEIAEQSDAIEAQSRSLQRVRENDIRQTEQLTGIDRKLDGVQQQLGIVLERLLNAPGNGGRYGRDPL
ncbi:MAG TPA: hypothetical protein VGB90_09675 [Alphaproteobacteria bacterium]|jgi:hypothetical protein